MKDTIKNILDNNFMKYNKEERSQVNFNELTNLLNIRFNDRRYKVKVLAARTSNDSFIMKYRGKRFYCYKNKNDWTVEKD